MLLLLFLPTILSTTFIPPSHPSLYLNGRTVPSISPIPYISYDHPGITVSIAIQGSSYIDILLQQKYYHQPNIFWIYLDKQATGDIIDTSLHTYSYINSSDGNSSYTHYQSTPIRYPLVRNLTSDPHVVSIMKVTEADWNNPNPTPNYIDFHGFIIDSGDIIPLPDPPIRRVEFVGDSITAGYCNMCKGADEGAEGYTLESFGASWPTLVCDAFQADCHTAAWSGLGMVRNCCGGDVFMPEIYTRALASVSGSVWSFDGSWTPDVVVINLGTNDGLDPDSPGILEEEYQNTYVEFVRNISTWYTPSPTFFLACGPMSDAYCGYVHNVIYNLTAGDHPLSVHFLDQTGVLDDSNRCCDHPDEGADKILADITLTDISDVMGWDYTP